jgi:hypothetical protein
MWPHKHFCVASLKVSFYDLYSESMLMLILVALNCAIYAKRVTLQVNDMHLVDTLQILIGSSSYNKDSRLAQVAKTDGNVDFS